MVTSSSSNTHPVLKTLRVLTFLRRLLTPAMILGATALTASPGHAYDFGSLPSGVSADVNGWKSGYVRDCPDGSKRVDDGTGNTVSEGIGYGMLIASMSNDEALLAGLWKYYKARRNKRGFMNWKYQGCSMDPAELNGASDADLDVAMGLVLAAQAFPGKGYDQEAGWQVEALRQYNFDDCDGRLVLRPGDSSGFGGCECANPSYFAPGYFRAFAAFTPKQATFWNRVASDAYKVLGDNQHPSSGLVSAWSTSTGQTGVCDVAEAGGGDPGDYQYDAARTPWRIGLDYAWHGDEQAKNFLTKMTAWVKQSAGLPGGVGDGYAKDGGRRSDNKNSVFIGGFASGAIINASDANTVASAWQSGPYKGGDNAYYTKSLQVLYSLFLSNRFTEPSVTCTPAACGARICGTDGCGGSCGECENGEACSGSGTCGCEAPELSCGGQCVDTRSDANHCGGCDMACATGLVCNARNCSSTCKVLGERDCGSGCIDILADPFNCGGCGEVCPVGLGCVQAECAEVEDGPVSTGEPNMSDPGPAPIRPPTAVCVDSTCDAPCESGFSACGEQCLDSTNDPRNCGGCDRSCAPGEFCSSGSCSGACPEGFRQCGNICSRTSSDVENCGSCGNICSAGNTCIAGNCLAFGTSGDDEEEAGSSGCSVNAVSPNGGLPLTWVLSVALGLLIGFRRRVAA